MAKTKDLSALVARYEAKIEAKPEKAASLQLKLNAKIAKQVEKGNTVLIDGQTVTAYTLGQDSGGTDGGTTPTPVGSTFTLTASTTASYADRSAPVNVTINGDNDPLTGTDFNLTLTKYNDTFIAGEHRSTVVDASDGVDTLDLSQYDNGVLAVDANLESGTSNVEITTKGFENVIASETGGRIVGTTGANTFTANEGDDDFSTGGGDDVILVDVDNLENDDYNGGSGTDTIKISGDDTVAMEAADEVISAVENLEITDAGQDLTVTLENYFEGTATSTTAVTNGIKKITLTGDAEDVLTLTSATTNNLIGVTILGAETIESDEEVVLGTTTTFTKGTILDATGAGDGLLVNGAGTFDLSGILISDFEDITGDASAQTIAIGQRTLTAYANDVDVIDGAGGTDTVTATGTTSLNLSRDVLTTGLTAVEVVDFGSADRAIVDEADFGSTEVVKVTGTSGSSDLLIIDGNGGAVTADLSATQITGVERILLDAAGNASTVTIGKSTLATGTTLIGDTGTDTITISGTDVDLAKATFEAFEVLDLNSNQIASSVTTFNQFSRIDDSAGGGSVVLSDSGTVTLRTVTAGATDSFTLYFADNADTVNFSTSGFDDNGAAVVLRTAGGDDVMTIGSNGIDLGATTVNLGSGNDTFNLGSLTNLTTAEMAVATDGGDGTADKLTFASGTVANAGGSYLDNVTNVEILALAGATASASSITLTTAAAWNTVDLSLDTNATGTNTVDLGGFLGRTMTLTGSAGAEDLTVISAAAGAIAETVSLGDGADSIYLHGNGTVGSAHTITLGDGRDEIFVTGSDAAGDTWTITDFNAAQDTINVGTWVAQSITQGVVNSTARASFAAARDAAFNSTAAGDWTAFQYGSDTYVIYDAAAGGNYNSAADVILKLSGLVSLTTTGAAPNVDANDLRGGATDDTIDGTADADTIIGGLGDDTITGADGVDSITGGSGDDRFTVGMGLGDLDVITDFAVGDELALNITTPAANTYFEGAVAAVATTDELVVITGAAVANAAALYGAGTFAAATEVVILFVDSDTNTAKLYYDADGETGGADGTELINFTGITTVAQLAAAFTDNTDFILS